MEITPASTRPLLRLVLTLSTVQGLALWFLTGALRDSDWPVRHPGFYTAAAALAAFLVPCIYALAEWIRDRRAWLLIGGIALLLTVFGLHLGIMLGRLQQPGMPEPEAIITHFIATFVLLFHLLPFAQTMLAGHPGWNNYPRLFSYAWRNALRLALALVFLGLTWLLLGVCAQLFDMLGIDFFRVIFFRDDRMVWLVSTLAFGIGVYFAENSDRLLVAVRQQVLGVLKWLVVLAAGILVLFSLALLVRSPALLASRQHVISATWLLWLAMLNIYLYNAGFQDGADPRPFPPLLGRLLRYAAPLLAIIATIAAYSLAVRVQAYGLTVARVWGFLVGVLVLIYSFGYLVAATRAGPWMATMARVNTIAALTLIGSLLLMLTPVLSPYRLTAGSMVARLVAKGDDIDRSQLNALRSQTGRYGRKALEALSKGGVSGASLALQRSAAEVLGGGSWNLDAVRSAESLALELLPAGDEVEPALRAAIASTAEVRALNQCLAKSPCQLLLLDWDRDGVKDAVLLEASGLKLFRKNKAGAWHPEFLQVTCQSPPLNCGHEAIAQALRGGDYELIVPKLPDLRVGHGRYRISQTGDAPGSPALGQ
jgi:hypothetical protein